MVRLLSRRGLLQNLLSFFLGAGLRAVFGGGTGMPMCALGTGKTVHVVGSGITGLSAGAVLARMGYHVVVLEAHDRLLGGHARTVEADGFRFAVGPQYVWSFRDGGIGERMLRFLDLGQAVPLRTMREDSFEHVIVAGSADVSVPMGLPRFRDLLVERYPLEEEGILTFFSWISDLYEASEVIYGQGLYTTSASRMSLALFTSSQISWRAKCRTFRGRNWSLSDLFDLCGLSPIVRRILHGHGAIFAESESEVSCVAYAGGTGGYHAGADFLELGIESLVHGLRDSIIDHGGEVLLGKRVSKLATEGGRITSVICSDGGVYPTDFVVSSISPRLTQELLDKSSAIQSSYAPSHSLLTCLLGLQGYPGLWEMLHGKNIWWQDGEGEVDYGQVDMTQPARMLYVGSPTCNAALSNTERDEHAVVVFAPASYTQGLDARGASEEQYESLRGAITEALLGQLESSLLPGLRNHLRTVRLLTPLDLYDELGCEDGNVYGRRLTAASLARQPYCQHGVSNLLIGCASTGMPGISTGMQTASVLVRKITGRNVL